MKDGFLLFGAGLMIALIAVARAATPAAEFPPLSVDLPGPGSVFEGTQAQILNENCTMCHSAGFVDRQPALPAAVWTAEVNRMRTVFGAPIDPAKIPELVDALVTRQGEMKK